MPPSFPSSIRQALANALIETGQALDRTALRMHAVSSSHPLTSLVMQAQANKLDQRVIGAGDALNFLKPKDVPYLFELPISRHVTLQSVFTSGTPYLESKLGDMEVTANTQHFIAPCASVIGDVKLGRGSSVWYGCVVRGDSFPRTDHSIDIDGNIVLEGVKIKLGINIGEGTNIQDNCVISSDLVSGQGVRVGKGCTIGHNAILIGCTIGDNVLVGMGSKILNGALIEPGVFLAANSVVAKDQVLSTGYLYAGSPARKIRELDEKMKVQIGYQAAEYVKLSQKHLDCMVLGGVKRSLGELNSRVVEGRRVLESGADGDGDFAGASAVGEEEREEEESANEDAEGKKKKNAA